MKVIRRVFSSIMLGVIFISGLRLSGHRETTPQRGGWQPLQLPDAADGRATARAGTAS